MRVTNLSEDTARTTCGAPLALRPAFYVYSIIVIMHMLHDAHVWILCKDELLTTCRRSVRPASHT